MARSELTAGVERKAAVTAAPAQRLIVTFSLAFLIFLIVPSFLSSQLPIYPLMKVEDAFTLLTPLVLIPLYWFLLKQAAGDRISSAVMLAYLLFSVLWVDGHGVHLAANSISHLLDEATSGSAGQLTYFYDEVMGHYLWHLGVIGLSVLLVAAEWRHSTAAVVGSLWPLGIAGIIYGLTFFMIVVEGQTSPLGVPFAALFALFGLIWGRQRFESKPLFTFFFVACLVALLLFGAWGIYWGGLPEFSAVGIIK